MNKTILISQIIMTFLMAAIMSGILGLIFGGGFSMEWLATWPKQFLIAWPIAFVVTMGAWPAAMALTKLIVKPEQAEASAPSAR